MDPSSSGSIQANNPSRDSVGVSYKASRGSEAGERGRMEGSRHRRARRSTFPERDLGASWRRGVWRNARDDRRAGRGQAGAKIRRGLARGALFDDDHPADDARERVSLQQNEIDSGRHSPAVAVPGVPGHGMGPRGERSLVQQAETAPGAIVDGEAVMSLSGEMEAHPGAGSRRVGNDAKGPVSSSATIPSTVPPGWNCRSGPTPATRPAPLSTSSHSWTTVALLGPVKP